MTARAIVAACFVGVAVVIALLSALGVAVMRDPLQRLHFIAPPATISASFIAVALFVDGGGWKPGAKMAIAAVVIALINGVVTHATARAARIRATGGWVPKPEEQVPIADGAPRPWTEE